METSKPVIGRRYTRDEIAVMVGSGDKVGYLPSKHKRIRAGCFVPRLNHNAPTEVDVGLGPNIIEDAKRIAAAKGVIPIFIKRRVNEWEYVGRFRCTGLSQLEKDLKPARERRPDVGAVLYFQDAESSSASTVPAPEVLYPRTVEGRRRLVTHLRIERNRTLGIIKRNQVLAEHKYLKCEACGINETHLPSEIGVACFEVHHSKPLAKLKKPAVTDPDDLELLCANCHNMIHRTDPMISARELRSLLRGSFSSDRM